MKTVEEMKSMLFERLADLQGGNLRPHHKIRVKFELALLYDILGEEIDEDYWEEIEKFI